MTLLPVLELLRRPVVEDGQCAQKCAPSVGAAVGRRHPFDCLPVRREDVNEARYWVKVSIKGEGECWPWLASKNAQGYGSFSVNGVLIVAHRVAVILSGREIPNGMKCSHLCCNPSCCNPAHINIAPAVESKHRCHPVFSDEDADLKAFNWRLNRGGYARRKANILAHRVIGERIAGRALSSSEIVDHINGDPLDNRRGNLRITNAAGSAQNRYSNHPWRGTTRKSGGKWQATVKHGGKAYIAGYFLDRECAARAAADKRRELGFLTNHVEAQRP